MLYDKMKMVGKKLFQAGLNNSHSGNISVRMGDTIYITRSGCMLGQIDPRDIIEVGLQEDARIDRKASIELLVHRAIYKSDEFIAAVVHAHAPFSIVSAEGCDEIIPFDHEARYYFDNIPVIHVENTIASPDVANRIVECVPKHKNAIIAKHGVFAWGKDIIEAYKFVSITESACKIKYLLDAKNASKNY